MRKFLSKRLIPLYTTLAVAGAWGQDQDLQEASGDRLADVQRYEATLEELETRFGPFDPRLQEPLLAMETAFEELGDFERVREIQSRRLQLLRTSQGLEHPDIIPVVEQIMRTEIQLGNWVEVSDHLDHLLTLALANYGNESDEVMAAMERQASWYLARVYLDRNRERTDNYMESRELYDDLLDLAEDRYGEDNPQLIPWLYRRAYSLYQLVAMLNAEGGIRSAAVRETLRRDGEARLQSARARGFYSPSILFNPANRIPVTDGDELVGVSYLRQANGYIDDIKDIAEAEDDWETWAMATLYHGDYSLLRGRNTGRGDYREAREKLTELGYSEQRLEQFFNRPMLIPVARFFTRFDQIESYQSETRGGLQPSIKEGDEDEEYDPDEPWDRPVHVGLFLAWEDDVPAVAMPLIDDPVLAVNLPFNQTDMQFRVNGNGKVSAVDVIATDPEDRRARRDAVRAARNLQFRPALYEGRARARRNVQLRYQIFPEDN